MKYSMLALSLLLFVSCKEENPKSPEVIEATLQAFVEGETLAYMAKDYEKWASYWDHSTDVLRLDVTNSGFSQTRGWDKSGGNLEQFFKENPDPITATFENSNYLIFYDTKLAWLAFDQTWTTTEGEKSVAKATITLVRKENSWKIISYTAIQYEAENEAVDTLSRT